MNRRVKKKMKRHHRWLGSMVLLSLIAVGGCSQTTKATKQTSESSSSTIETSTIGSTSTATSTMEKKITALSDDQITLAVYVENYLVQYPNSDINTAIEAIKLQPEFMIEPTEEMVQVSQSQDIGPGVLVSQLTLSGDGVQVNQFNGSQQVSEQQFTKAQLSEKYTDHIAQLNELVQLANAHYQTKYTLTEEELAMAMYVDRYNNEKKPVNLFVDFILGSPTFRMYQENGQYIITHGVASSEAKVTIDGDRVLCGRHAGMNQDFTETATVAELSQKYANFKSELNTLITTGKNYNDEVQAQIAQRQAEDAKPKVDGTDLTIEQVKQWIGNYLLQTDRTTADVINHKMIYLISTDEKGYLHINARGDNPSGTISSSLGFYRINAQGELQEQVPSTDNWNTVSTTPLLNE